MAEIPVTKKSGIPWWGWLLALALLALLALAAFLWLSPADDNDSNDSNDPRPAKVVEPAAKEAPPGGKITSLAMLGRGALSGLVGRSVSLDNITVDSLAGDMSFYIKDASGDQVFVAFGQIPTPNNPAKEGELVIKSGTVLNLDGTVMAADAKKPDNVHIDLPKGTEAYIFARDIKIVR